MIDRFLSRTIPAFLRGATRRRPALGLVLAALLFAAAPARGQPVQAHEPQGEPGAELGVFLITMGPGDQVWERFGHNALWIHDPVRGTDKVYNYGIFDFEQEDFLLRFVQGRMLYWMAAHDVDLTIRAYELANRSVWIQELNLAPAAKLALRDFLEWNEQPENRYYRYDYYRDNCSTRVRDAIDLALGGSLRAEAERLPATGTYRDHTRRLTAGDPLVYTGLMLGLGSAADAPISVWEEMFLPMRLRDHLRTVTITDEEGREVPLVKSEVTVFEADRDPEPSGPPESTPGYLLIGLAGAAVLAGLGARVDRSRAARAGLAALAVTWALVSGMGGLLLAGLWGFTDHAIAYRNENLFQVNPLNLALVVLVPALALGWSRAARPALWIAGASAALAVLGLALKGLPIFGQVNGPIIALALPINVGLVLAIRSLSRGDRDAPGRG